MHCKSLEQSVRWGYTFSMSKKHMLQIVSLLVLAVAIYLIANNKVPGMMSGSQTDQTPSTVAGVPNGIPPLDPNSVGKIVTDPSNGKQFLSNDIIVGFKSGVSEQEALGVIAGVGGKMIARFTQVSLFHVQVPDKGDGKSALAIIATLKKDPKVDASNTGPNYLTTKDSTPTQP